MTMFISFYYSKMMRPYGGKCLTYLQEIFNYRLSRFRRVSENGFGILATRWRFLLTSINLNEHKVSKYATTAILLHNMLINERDSRAKAIYCPPNLVDQQQPG